MSDEGPPQDEPYQPSAAESLALWNRNLPELERGLIHLLGTLLSQADYTAIMEQARELALTKALNASQAQTELQKLIQSQALSYALVNAKDKATLVLLYAQVPRLERHVERKFGSLASPEERTDIAHNTVVNAYERRHDYNPALAKPETWLAKRVEFATLTYLRKRQIVVPYDELREGEIAEDASTAETTLDDTKPLLAALAEVLAHMPPRRAEALRRYLEGESYEAIAQALNTTNGNVRSHVSRGLNDLRRKESQVRKLLRLAARNPLLTVMVVVSIQFWMIPIIMGAPLAHAPAPTPVRSMVRPASTASVAAVHQDYPPRLGEELATLLPQALAAITQPVAAAPWAGPAPSTQLAGGSSYPPAVVHPSDPLPPPGSTYEQAPVAPPATPLATPDLPSPSAPVAQPSATLPVASELPPTTRPRVSPIVPTATAVSRPIGGGGVPAGIDPEPEPTLATATPNPTLRPNPSPSPTASSNPSPTMTASPTRTPSPSPTASPNPSPTPTASPTRTPSPSPTPAGSHEPDYPACPLNTRLLEKINGGVRRDREPRTQSYSLTLSETGRLLILGYVKEGHPEDCPDGPRCRQGQLFEEFRLQVDDSLVAEYNDQGNIDAWIAVGPWYTASSLDPGAHRLSIAHLGRGSTAESVDYKLALCLAPTLTTQPPSPSPSAAITMTAVPEGAHPASPASGPPTPTTSVPPTPTALPVAWGNPSRPPADPSDARDATPLTANGATPRLALVFYYG